MNNNSKAAARAAEIRALKKQPPTVNYDHISDAEKLAIWGQAKVKAGVIVQSVGGV